MSTPTRTELVRRYLREIVDAGLVSGDEAPALERQLLDDTFDRENLAACLVWVRVDIELAVRKVLQDCRIPWTGDRVNVSNIEKAFK